MFGLVTKCSNSIRSIRQSRNAWELWLKFFQATVKTEKGNTSGMSAHLRTSHPDLFMALKSNNESAAAEPEQEHPVEDSKDPDYKGDWKAKQS